MAFAREMHIFSGVVRRAQLPVRTCAPFSRAFSRSSDDNVDYYKVLGVLSDATTEQIKHAFREQAKQHHPDLKRSATEADVHVFKAINEAYGVLSDSSRRREYDFERNSSRRLGASLRLRNEGSFAGAGPVDRPNSIYEAPADWQGSRAATGSAATYEQQGEGEFDQEGAFRLSMVRANEKQKDSARVRAAMARMNRPRIVVPDQSSSWLRMAGPVAVVGLWMANYFMFMR